MRRHWKVRVSATAEADFEAILAWTEGNFGERQAQRYAQTMITAIEALALGPSATWSKPRPEIGPNVQTLHVARKGNKGRHFVVFQVATPQTVEVLRILHDSMDLQRHMAGDGGA